MREVIIKEACERLNVNFEIRLVETTELKDRTVTHVATILSPLCSAVVDEIESFISYRTDVSGTS